MTKSVLDCNKEVIRLLEKVNPKAKAAPEVLNKLKKAILLLQSQQDQPLHNKLMAITLNNVACYYKK